MIFMMLFFAGNSINTYMLTMQFNAITSHIKNIFMAESKFEEFKTPNLP